MIRATRLALLSFPLLSGSAWALDPCRGTNVLESGRQGAQSVRVGAVGHRLMSESGVLSLSMRIGVEEATDLALKPGFQLTYVLEDETTVTLTSAREAASSKLSYVSDHFAGMLTSWNVEFPLSNEAVHALASSPVSSIRFEVNGREHMVAPKSRSKRSMQVDYACFANHLGTS